MKSLSNIGRRKYSMLGTRVLFSLLALSLFLLPLNGLPYKRFLGELSLEGAAYPMLIAFVVYGLAVVKQGKLKIPHHLSYQLLIFFLGWLLISGLLNFTGILTNFTKGRSGVEKFSLQLMLTLFLFFVSMVSYETLRRFRKREVLFVFRKWILFSFLFAGIYSFLLEIPARLGQGWALTILGVVTPVLHGSDTLYLVRLRSLSGEASWFGMYLAFVFPWLVSYLFSEGEKYRYLYLALSGYMLVLTYLTFSRTAYIIIAFQISVFVLVIFLNGTYRYRVQLLKLLLIAVLFSGLLIVNTNAGDKLILIFSSLFQQDTKLQLSNIARFGMQITAVNIGLEHPLAGVGLGQYGFYVSDYLPSWAWVSYEARLWVSSFPDTPWAPVHGLWARMLAETGFVGLFLWFSVWISVLISVWKYYRKLRQIDPQHSILALSLLISIFGLILNGMVSDSLRSLSYWITLGVTWAWLAKRTDKIHLKDEFYG